MHVHSHASLLESKRGRIMKKLEDPNLFDHVRKHAIDVELPMIEAALVRVVDGTHEECIDCGEGIEPDRLKAIPEISTCKSCGRERDVHVARRS